jgi:hypothetical protein
MLDWVSLDQLRSVCFQTFFNLTVFQESDKALQDRLTLSFMNNKYKDSFRLSDDKTILLLKTFCRLPPKFRSINFTASSFRTFFF